MKNPYLDIIFQLERRKKIIKNLFFEEINKLSTGSILVHSDSMVFVDSLI